MSQSHKKEKFQKLSRTTKWRRTQNKKREREDDFSDSNDEAAIPTASANKDGMVFTKYNFERGYADMVMKLTGKRTLSSSENEERGKGRRAKRRKRLLYEDIENFAPLHSSDSDSADSENSDDPAVVQDNIQPLTNAKKMQCFPIAEFSPTSFQIPKKHAITPITPTSSTIGRPLSGRKCPCPEKMHACSFEGGNVTLQSIGQALCHISRTLSLYKSKFNYLQEEINEVKQLVECRGDSGGLLQSTEESTTLDESIQGFFPIDTLQRLKEVEKKLIEDKEFYKSCVVYFGSAPVKGTESRTVTSILGRLISLEVAQLFTFKGVARKDHKERKEAFKDLNLSRVLLSALQRSWPRADIKKACLTAARWLAQAKFKNRESEKGCGRG